MECDRCISSGTSKAWHLYYRCQWARRNRILEAWQKPIWTKTSRPWIVQKALRNSGNHRTPPIHWWRRDICEQITIPGNHPQHTRRWPSWNCPYWRRPWCLRKRHGRTCGTGQARSTLQHARNGATLVRRASCANTNPAYRIDGGSPSKWEPWRKAFATIRSEGLPLRWKHRKRPSAQLSITNRGTVIHSTHDETRDLHTYEPARKKSKGCEPDPLEYCPASLTKFSINEKGRAGIKEIPRPLLENIYRCSVRGGRVERTNQSPDVPGRPAGKMVQPVPGRGNSVSNGGGVYHGLRRGKGYLMGIAIPEGIEPAPETPALHGQWRSIRAEQEPEVCLKEPAHRTPVSLLMPASPLWEAGNNHDSGKGQPGGCPHQTPTYDDTEHLENSMDEYDCGMTQEELDDIVQWVLEYGRV